MASPDAPSRIETGDYQVWSVVLFGQGGDANELGVADVAARGTDDGLQTACIDGSIVATGCCHPVFRLGWGPCRRLREGSILPLGATGLAWWGTGKAARLGCLCTPSGLQFLDTSILAFVESRYCLIVPSQSMKHYHMGAFPILTNTSFRWKPEPVVDLHIIGVFRGDNHPLIADTTARIAHPITAVPFCSPTGPLLARGTESRKDAVGPATHPNHMPFAWRDRSSPEERGPPVSRPSHLEQSRFASYPLHAETGAKPVHLTRVHSDKTGNEQRNRSYELFLLRPSSGDQNRE